MEVIISVFKYFIPDNKTMFSDSADNIIFLSFHVSGNHPRLPMPSPYKHFFHFKTGIKMQESSSHMR